MPTKTTKTTKATKTTKTVKRAAPTRVVSENRDSSIKFYIALAAIAVVVCGGAVFLGKSDTGVINVTAAISDANQIRREANKNSDNPESTEGEVPNVREIHRRLPNGGLVPVDVPEEETKPAPQPEEDETSSTTEDGIDEEAQEETFVEEVASDEEITSEEESPVTEEASEESISEEPVTDTPS